MNLFYALGSIAFMIFCFYLAHGITLLRKTFSTLIHPIKQGDFFTLGVFPQEIYHYRV